MKRVLLAIVLATGAAQAQTTTRPHLELPSQQLTDGQKTQFMPLTTTHSRAARETRPLMIGGGIVVLAAIVWWNRKRREQFDRSDVADSDELQAAARGEKDEHE